MKPISILLKNWLTRIKAFIWQIKSGEHQPIGKVLVCEVLAMIKQLGCPSFFLTLSFADLEWKEIPEIISKLNKLTFSEEYSESMNYFEKCELLNSYPVLLPVLQFCSLPMRNENTGLVSSEASLTSWGEGSSLTVADHPSSDGVTIKMPYGVDVLHQPASHHIFSYWDG